MVVDDEHVTISNGMLSLNTHINIKYVTPKSQIDQTSQAASISHSVSQQHVSNEDPHHNQNTGPNVFNVQLNYDLNQALDPDSWNSSFHAVSLHDSIEYLALDALNIRESLFRMHKYILGKSIENDGANNIEDFKGMDKAL